MGGQFSWLLRCSSTEGGNGDRGHGDCGAGGGTRCTWVLGGIHVLYVNTVLGFLTLDGSLIDDGGVLYRTDWGNSVSNSLVVDGGVSKGRLGSRGLGDRELGREIKVLKLGRR
jgi:hypothetical protein